MEFIKRSWVINLHRRPDRLEDFVKRTNHAKIIFPNFKKFCAIDGKQLFDRFPQLLEEHLLKFLKTMLMEQLWTDNWMITEGKEGRWREGEIGCLLSHYSILMKIVEDEELQDHDMCLVMEDDLFMNSDFNAQMEAMNTLFERNPDIVRDLDVIWIAGRNREHFLPSDKNNPNVYEQISGNLYLRKTMNKEN